MHRLASTPVICGLFAIALAFHEPLRGVTLAVIRAPFTITKSAVSTLILLPRLPAVDHENRQLREALTRQAVELSQAREELRHLASAQALREQSQAAGAPVGDVVSVIGRSPIPTRHTILIDGGQRDGIERDAILVNAGGVVGRVIEVHARTSLGMLISDPESRIAGLIERTRESGLLVGQGSGLCRLLYLDADADIVEGDRVITAGVGGAYPKGLWLGTVVHVTRDAEAGSAAALVRPSANLSRLEDILCLRPSPS